MILLNNLIEIIKKAALDAVEANKPVNVLFGVVTNISPLQINIDQKMTIDDDSLFLTNAVKDHTVEMTVDHVTENTSVGNGSHNHAYKGKKQFTVHNGLVVGEKVILLRMQGGQKFVVWDRYA